jgi:hypothetical protein
MEIIPIESGHQKKDKQKNLSHTTCNNGTGCRLTRTQEG